MNFWSYLVSIQHTYQESFDLSAAVHACGNQIFMPRITHFICRQLYRPGESRYSRHVSGIIIKPVALHIPATPYIPDKIMKPSKKNEVKPVNFTPDVLPGYRTLGTTLFSYFRSKGMYCSYCVYTLCRKFVKICHFKLLMETNRYAIFSFFKAIFYLKRLFLDL